MFMKNIKPNQLINQQKFQVKDFLQNYFVNTYGNKINPNQLKNLINVGIPSF